MSRQSIQKCLRNFTQNHKCQPHGCAGGKNRIAKSHKGSCCRNNEIFQQLLHGLAQNLAKGFKGYLKASRPSGGKFLYRGSLDICIMKTQTIQAIKNNDVNMVVKREDQGRSCRVHCMRIMNIWTNFHFSPSNIC